MIHETRQVDATLRYGSKNVIRTLNGAGRRVNNVQRPIGTRRRRAIRCSPRARLSVGNLTSDYGWRAPRKKHNNNIIYYYCYHGTGKQL